MKRKFGGALIVGAISAVIIYLFSRFLNGILFGAINLPNHLLWLNHIIIPIVWIVETAVAMLLGSLLCRAVFKSHFDFGFLIFSSTLAYVSAVVLEGLYPIASPFVYMASDFVICSLCAWLLWELSDRDEKKEKCNIGHALLLGAFVFVAMHLFAQFVNSPLAYAQMAARVYRIVSLILCAVELLISLLIGTKWCKKVVNVKFRFWAILVASIGATAVFSLMNALIRSSGGPLFALASVLRFANYFLFAWIVTATAKSGESGNLAAAPAQEDREKTALHRTHRKAKSKLVWGIVLMAVAFVVEIAGLMVMMEDEMVGLLMVAATGVMWAIGIPCFITGLIGTIKANRNIRLYEQEQKKAAAAPAPAVEPTVVAQAPVVEETAPASEPATEAQEEAPKTEPSATGFVDIDWQKYSPLDAGVSYKKDKDYKFQRYDGFAGSVPQKFVDRTFVKCPICCTATPNWTVSQHNQMSWKGNLYLFKCSCCEGIISMSMPDVTTLGNGGSGVALNPSVGLTNLMVKAGSGKEAGAVYAVIESVGTSGVTPEVEGKEFKLEHVQEMFLRM